MTTGLARRVGGAWLPLLQTLPEPPVVVPPVVKPIPTFTTTVSGATVKFDGSGSRSVNGSIVAWSWTFDDGLTSTDTTPTHTYTASGDYDVTLRVVDAVGLTASITRTVTVTVPVATGDRSNLVVGSYKPDATTTGLLPGWSKTQLTKFTTVTGSDKSGTPYFTPVSGTTYKNLWFNVRIVVGTATNVRFQNCWFDGGNTIPPQTQNTGLIDCTSSSTAAGNVIVEDSVFAMAHPNVSMDAIIGRGYTIRRCNLYDVVDGCGAYATGAMNVTVEACWIHDLAYRSPDPNHGDNRTHNDGIQIQGGSNCTIRGNRIDATVSTIASSTSPTVADPYLPSVTGQAIGITPNLAQVTGVLIEQNWVDYGANSITIIQGSKFAGSTVGIIRNNRFGRNQPTIGGRKRPMVIAPAMTVTGMPGATGADTQGNVYADTGAAITVYREVS